MIDRVLYVLVYPVLFVAYLAIVFWGYEVGVPKLLPDLPPEGAPLVAALVTAVIWLLAAIVARLHSNKTAGIGNKVIKYLIFALLYCFSGLGIANFLFYYSEVSTVLGQAIQTADDRLISFQALANGYLPSKEYNELSDQVNALVSQLESEITNPAACGVGSGAKDIIRRIKDQLPEFNDLTHPPPAQLPCTQPDRFKPLAENYRSNVSAQLLSSATYRNLRVKDRLALQTKINTEIQADKNLLTNLRDQVANLSTLPQLNSPGVKKIVSNLDQIEGEYKDNVKLFLSFQPLFSPPLEAHIPASLDLDNVKNIGHMFSTLNVIVSRISSGEASVWNILYILIPLLTDLLVVYVIYRVSLRAVWKRISSQPDHEVQYILSPS
jgi:hypothetical protein